MVVCSRVVPSDEDMYTMEGKEKNNIKDNTGGMGLACSASSIGVRNKDNKMV